MLGFWSFLNMLGDRFGKAQSMPQDVEGPSPIISELEDNFSAPIMDSDGGLVTAVSI